jgi:hypothetical protein
MNRSSRASLIPLSVLAALGALAGAAFASPSGSAPPHSRDAVRMVHADVEARTRAPIVVYVNRNGGSVGAGDDDSLRNTSSLVERGTVKVPPWKGGEARWKKVMACVRDRFSPFALEITEERPSGGDYIMAMVGGQPSLLGYDDEVSGIAPYTGDIMHQAIVYIFAAGVDYDVEITCVDVLHEVGHALGLDHEYLCQDPMSYLWDCDQAKTFQDADAVCGEDDKRACESGDKTQNSYQTLARNVGLRGDPQAPAVASAPEPAADEADDADDGPAPDVTTASAARTPAELSASVDGPIGVAPGNRFLTITVHGRGAALVADATLTWLAPDGNYAFSCAKMPKGSAATCRRKGDDFVFRLEVGTGWRYFAAVVTDADGDTATSDPTSVFLR